MGKVAIVGWTIVWAIALWAVDPASTVGGKPPAWALFEVWAAGLVVLGAIEAGILVGDLPRRARLEWRRMRSIPGAAILWTVAWMIVFPIWAADPRATRLPNFGPGGPQPVMKASEPVLYEAWLVGLAVLAAIWLLARARRTGLRSR